MTTLGPLLIIVAISNLFEHSYLSTQVLHPTNDEYTVGRCFIAAEVANIIYKAKDPLSFT